MKLILLAAALAFQEERPPDFTGQVVSAFPDGPLTLVNLRVETGPVRQGEEFPIYVKAGAKVSYVGLPEETRVPAAGMHAQVWLEKGSRDGAARVKFSRDRLPVPVPAPPPPPVRPKSAEVTLEAEAFKVTAAEVRDLPGASGGKALLFRMREGMGETSVRLPAGRYEVRLFSQGQDTDHDGALLIVAGREFRFYQDQWNRVASAKVKDVPQVLVEIPNEGEHKVVLKFAEAGVYVDRVMLVPMNPRPDDEGFIREWHILAPIRPKRSAAEELDRESLEGEKRLRARRDGPAWKRHVAPEWFIDFNTLLGRAENNAVGYAVCTLIADEELKDLELRMGCDDHAKVWLNGKEVLKHTGQRSCAKDTSVARGLTLKKGENHVVFKVVNEATHWQGGLRFVDKSGRPVRNLRVSAPSE